MVAVSILQSAFYVQGRHRFLIEPLLLMFMTAVSLAFLVVCMFGAFAYGSATVMTLRQASPVWGVPPTTGMARARLGSRRMKPRSSSAVISR
mgnify:CR=1 FL=1